MDLSQLSTEDLVALKSGDLSKVSTQGLMALRGQAAGPAPSGFMKGLNDIAAGGAQLLTHALPDSVVSGVNRATQFVNDLPGIGPVTQALGMVPATSQQIDQQISETGKRYEAARAAAGKTGIDWARGAGQALGAGPLAAVLPVAGVTVPARALAGALGGGTGALVQPVETPGDYAAQKAVQVGTGAAVGAVAAPIMGAVVDKAVKAIGAVKNFFTGQRGISVEEMDRVLRDNISQMGGRWEDLSEQVRNSLRQQVMGALSANRNLDPAAAARAADFSAEGIRPTLGQVTRDAGQFAAERNLRTLPGTGDPLLQRFQEQGAQLQARLGAFAQGVTSDRATAGQRLAEALRAFDEGMSRDVAVAYRTARASAGKDAEVPLQGLAQDVADIFDRYRSAVPSGIRGQFAKLGLDPAEVVNQRRIFTVEEADKLLKEINRQGSNEPAVQSALSELRAAVKRAVVGDAGVEDVFAPARALAAKRFQLQEAVPALEAAATGRVAPDDFVRRFVINGKASEVQGMANILRQSAPEAYAEARAQVGAQLQRAAFGSDLAGDAAFNPKQFAKVLTEMGDSKLKAFFSDAEIAQLHRLSRIGAYINQVPNAAPVQTSNNWGAITAAASRIPGVPAIVGIARAAGNAVGNERAVFRALTAQVPTKQPQLDPETARLLARALTASSMAAGAAVQ